MKVKKWKEVSRKEVLSGHIFKYSVREIASQTSDKKGDFDLIECLDWVNILAITKFGEVILVKQYRNGVDDLTYEIPGGGVHPGEDPILAAKRELKEEAGFSSEQWSKLGEVDVNPAFMNNKCFFYLAKDCVDSGVQELDPLEEIEVQTKALEQIDKMLEKGEISHSLCVLAFCLYKLKNS